MDGSEKIRDIAELEVLRETWRKEGRRLVQCHGCFDIVHPGHIRYLRFAKSLGDILLVSVSADDVVGKGPDRPYVPESLRLENLAALELVDYVMLSTETWGGAVLERIRPDVYVKGREYESNNDPRFAKEREIVTSYGGKVVFSSGDVVFSSTEILKRKRGELGLDRERVDLHCRQHGITPESVDALTARFASLRVVVVGDPILDHYVLCEGATVASEAPVLSVVPLEEQWYVGGAGLLARQMVALGAHVTYVTVGREDAEMERLTEGLTRAGVELELLPVDSRPLYLKTRFLAGTQKLLKVNRGLHSPLPTSVASALGDAVERHLAEADGLVLSDFGYGLFGDPLCARLATASARANKPYYADVSANGHANILKFHAPRLVTPTEHELRFALADAESGLSNLAARYYQKSGAEQLIVTLGARGAISFERGSASAPRLRTMYLPALEQVTVDTVGAGDRLLSGAVLTDLVRGSAAEALFLGSALAAASLTSVGNDVVGLAELTEYAVGRLG